MAFLARALCAARSAGAAAAPPARRARARARGPGANPPPRLRPMRRRRRRPTAIGALRAEGFGFRRPIHRGRSARGARRRRAARPRGIRRGIHRARRRTTSSSRGSVGATSRDSVCAQRVLPTPSCKFRTVRRAQCRARRETSGSETGGWPQGAAHTARRARRRSNRAKGCQRLEVPRPAIRPTLIEAGTASAGPASDLGHHVLQQSSR